MLTVIPADTDLTLAECPRCGAPVLAGHSGGLRWRLERFTVPSRHAAVLAHYGVAVLVVDRRVGGRLAGAPWTVDHDLSRPGRYLAVPHVCGCAHSNWKGTFL